MSADRTRTLVRGPRVVPVGRAGSSPCRLAGVLVPVLVSGCGASRLPTPAADRPLTLPAGENRVSIGAGVRAGSDFSPSPTVALSGEVYARGITDRLELRLPLIARYRLLGEAEGVSFGLESGVYGWGVGLGRRLEPFEDPRQPPRFGGDLTLFPGGGFLGRIPFAGGLTLVGQIIGVFGWDFYEVSRPVLSSEVGIIHSPWP